MHKFRIIFISIILSMTIAGCQTVKQKTDAIVEKENEKFKINLFIGYFVFYNWNNFQAFVLLIRDNYLILLINTLLNWGLFTNFNLEVYICAIIVM